MQECVPVIKAKTTDFIHRNISNYILRLYVYCCMSVFLIAANNKT